MQVIRGESKSKRIPCQTSTLKHTILWSLMRFMWEMHELISVTVSYECKLLKKNHTGKECEDEVILTAYQILKM